MSAKQLPRGIRNNNPGNVEDDGTTAWQGLDVPRNDGRFLRCKTAADGVRILARILITYQDKRRAPDGSAIDTVPEFLNRFAPSHENDTGAYINGVCQDLGVGPKDPVDVHDYKTARGLVVAIIAHENANYAYPAAVIDEGLRMAGIKPPLQPLVKDPQLIAGTAVASATAAAQAVGQVETVWGSLQRMGINPHLVLAALGALALGLAAWWLIGRWRARQLGTA